MCKLRPEAKEAYEHLRAARLGQFKEELPEEPGKETKEILENYPIIFNDPPCEKRHWKEIPTIYRVGDCCIRASIAETTGDLSPEEMGWEFDPNSMAVVYPVRIMVTKYRTLEEINNR